MPDCSKVPWAKEFRYDGARQRYAVYDFNIEALEGGSISIHSAIRTDYGGDGAYLGFQSSVGIQRQFEPVLALIESNETEGDDDTLYYHTDHLGLMLKGVGCCRSAGFQGSGCYG